MFIVLLFSKIFSLSVKINIRHIVSHSMTVSNDAVSEVFHDPLTKY